MHNSYWSCSKFADWLRGESKPFALGFDEWDDWHKSVKQAHPFRYWLADKALNKLQDIIYSPVTLYRAIDTYFHNRFIDRSHLIQTGLAVGCYHEFEDKVMHGLFTEFVDFVEIEMSLCHRAWNDGPRKPRRNAEWGLKRLEWEMSLTHGEPDCVPKGDPLYGQPTPQAVAALETMRLYKWWKETRPNRPDPHDVFEDGDTDRLFSDDPDIRVKFKHLQDVEAQYDREDNAYLVRLVLHRKCLWT